jgi:hypothetical protein
VFTVPGFGSTSIALATFRWWCSTVIGKLRGGKTLIVLIPLSIRRVRGHGMVARNDYRGRGTEIKRSTAAPGRNGLRESHCIRRKISATTNRKKDTGRGYICSSDFSITREAYFAVDKRQSRRDRVIDKSAQKMLNPFWLGRNSYFPFYDCFSFSIFEH